MAKTINKDIDIFTNEKSARNAFNKETKPCHLLLSKRYNSYFIDRSKTALKEWPNLYELIDEKFGG